MVNRTHSKFRRVLSASVFLMLYSTVATAAQPRDEVIWEITNRFSPFELTSDPTKTFKSYKLKDDENWVQWHERQWDEQGSKFNSPYAHALLHNQKTHWDETKQEHDASLLKFIREEQSPETTVNISIHYPSTDECVWKIGNQQPTQPAPCDKPQYFDIPLKGTKVAVEINGKELSTDSESLYLKPTHLVIVGFGDSYGSGEGNPDVPAAWKKGFKPKSETTAWLNQSRNLERNGRARWLDNRCHRSFFSQQSLTALGIASRSRTTFVSFLHYACTGAEMFDGLLTPQFAPGHSKGYNKYSQLNAAIRDFCRLRMLGYHPADIKGSSKKDFGKLLRINDTELRPHDELDKKLRKQRRATAQMAPTSGVVNCPTTFMQRKPDIVLLSIGGNDIGFADIVRYFVVPVEYKVSLATNVIFPKICPAENYSYDKEKYSYAEKYCLRMLQRNGYDAGTLIGLRSGHIATKYSISFQLIQKYLGVSPEQVFLTQYPDPLRTKATDTEPCEPLQFGKQAVFGSDEGYHIESEWNALKAAIPLNFGRDWEFNLRPSEAIQLLGQFDELRAALATAGKFNHVNVVCRVRDAFVGHGWWKGTRRGLPSHAPAWAPSEWTPYAYETNGRAVRTANDSYLTQAGVPNPLHGTAHPNLLGHSLIADIIMEEVKDKVP